MDGRTLRVPNALVLPAAPAPAPATPAAAAAAVVAVTDVPEEALLTLASTLGNDARLWRDRRMREVPNAPEASLILRAVLLRLITDDSCDAGAANNRRAAAKPVSGLLPPAFVVTAPAADG